MFDAEFQRRCQRLHGIARRSWGRRFLARKLHKRLAGGTEVTDHADYAAGDDIRYVDWNRCARHDELLTKRFQGNEDHTVYLLLDSSASMRMGTPSKFELARRITATLAYLALANLDRVAVLLFSDRIVDELEPLRGKRHAPRVFRFLEQATVHTSATDLSSVAQSFIRRRRPGGLVVLISDLFDPTGFQQGADLLRRNGHEPCFVQVFDRYDAEPGLAGGVRLNDVESSWSLRATIDEEDLVNYRLVYDDFRQMLRRYCARYQLGITHARTDMSHEECIGQIINTAKQRLAAQS